MTASHCYTLCQDTRGFRTRTPFYLFIFSKCHPKYFSISICVQRDGFIVTMWSCMGNGCFFFLAQASAEKNYFQGKRKPADRSLFSTDLMIHLK